MQEIEVRAFGQSQQFLKNKRETGKGNILLRETASLRAQFKWPGIVFHHLLLARDYTALSARLCPSPSDPAWRAAESGTNHHSHQGRSQFLEIFLQTNIQPADQETWKATEWKVLGVHLFSISFQIISILLACILRNPMMMLTFSNLCAFSLKGSFSCRNPPPIPAQTPTLLDVEAISWFLCVAPWSPLLALWLRTHWNPSYTAHAVTRRS